MTVAAHPYAAFVHRVQKPARYLGGEHGATVKPWASARARVCLAFPDVYEIGMSHLGLRILYGIFAEHPACLAERCYAPWPDMEAELRGHALPLVSLESARPLRDFDVVGFSLQFELSYTNVLSMLELGGIPLRSVARGEDDPLVLAGGPVATHAEPIAPFVDALVIGDGEEKAVEVALTWAACTRAGMPRRERLVELARLGGVYVPSLYALREDGETGLLVIDRPLHEGVPARVERALVRDLERFPLPSGGPVASSEAVFDRVSLEIARGCTEGCRFCQAGMIYRPVRERDPDAIVEAITRAVREGGYDEAALTSLSTADYSCIGPLVREVNARLRGEKVALSVSSLRAYGLSEEVLDEISRERTTGLTFAPEAGTQRMRDVVNKNVTEAQLMETAERVFSRGWSRMKLYFMIGLPTEEDEDVAGIVETGERALLVGKRAAPRNGARVTVSVSTHVPKPHTPFQWCAMDTVAEIERKQTLLRRLASSDAATRRREVFLDRDGEDHDARAPRKEKGRRRAQGVELRLHDPRGSMLEGVFARGDRRLADVLEHAYRAGARFDSWDEHLDLDRWNAAFEACGLDPARYLGTLPVTARLPWDHLDVGLEDGFLAGEYRKALANRLSPPCGKAVGMFVQHQNERDASADRRKLVCYDCGVACDLTQMREERLVYLRKLGAAEPFVPAARLTGAEAGKGRPRPPAREHQGTTRRARFAFRKLGRSAFVSHLDLVRILPRIFRRAGVRLRYTEGFHPKPELAFSPALPVGTAGLRELLDVRLLGDEPLDAPAMLGALALASPEGLELTGVVLLGPEDAGISRVVEVARYAVGLPRAALEALGIEHVGELAERVARGRTGELSVERWIDGIGRTIDVGRYLLDVRAGDGAERLAEAGIAGAYVPLELDVRVTGQGTARPGEVLEAVLGLRDVPLPIVRVGLYAVRDGVLVDPMDPVAARRPRALGAAAEAADDAAELAPIAEAAGIA